jgi:hypothetical protein
MKPALVAVLLAGCADSAAPPIGTWNVTPLTAWTCASPPAKPVQFKLTDRVYNEEDPAVEVTFEDGRLGEGQWVVVGSQLQLRHIDSRHGSTTWDANVGLVLSAEKNRVEGAWDTDADGHGHCHFEMTAELQ